MATEVFIAHTGQRLQVDTSQFSSLDEFKSAVSRQSSIPNNCIIALAPDGKAIKGQTIQTEKSICVFDKRVSQATSPGAGPSVKTELPLPKQFTATEPPNDLREKGSLQAWLELFKSRRNWAVKLADECSNMANTAQDRYSEMDVMMRCLDAAILNLESVVKGSEAKYAETTKWLTTAKTEHAGLVSSWEGYLSLARSVPTSAEMIRFMTGRDLGGGKGRPPRQATLEDLVDLETARKAGKLAPSALRKFNSRVAELERSAPRMSKDLDGLNQDWQKLLDNSPISHQPDPLNLLEDVEALAQKIETDYQTTINYSGSQRDLAQASQIASAHTRNLLPSLQSRAAEMDEMLRFAAKARNTLAAQSIEFMRSITQLTILSTEVRKLVDSLSDEEDLAHFDYLRLIQQIPYVYASFVAEAIKRLEWFDKVKTDSSTLANEMAVFQDEELKRRKKWQKAMEALSYGPDTPASEGRVPGLEVNLLGEDEEWPRMTRPDLDEFFGLLKAQKADQELIEDIAKMIAELNNPTKQQSRRLKAFKNGSVHEAALGRSGLMIRGDEELVRTLQDDNARVQGKLKTAESRIRRLEDLLHRQTQTSRPTLGNLFQAPSQQLSDRADSTISIKSPRPSVDGRRRSSAAGSEIGLVRRINQLEGELVKEKEKSAIFEKEIDTRTTEHNDMKSQMDEANSTKRDLLENMEALKREFDGERKSLETEIKHLKSQIEDTEDQIEHFGESRENEKASYDHRVQELEDEIEALRKGHAEEVLEIQGQVEFLRKESRLQQEQNEALGTQLQAAQAEAQSLTKNLNSLQETVGTQLNALKGVHGQVFEDAKAPEDLNDLIEAVTGKAADLISRLQELEGDASLFKKELDHEQTTAKDLRADIAQTKEKLTAEEMASMHLREELSEANAKVTALENELSEGRQQLDGLRGQLADGETGSVTLQKKLQEDEQKLAKLSEELAAKQSQVGSVKEELRMFQDKFADSQSKLSTLASRFEARTERTKDLTQRLYTQNDRLCRLLDRLGFAITRDGDSMSITKVPRAERSQYLPEQQNDGSTSVRRSSSLGKALGENGEIELLYWMDNADTETESEKYTAYLSSLGNFDVDAFSETVHKRVKDVEHIARKLQRDVRGYREKAHALQKDAQDKIAFRHFKEGDLALFLPTRNQTTGAWAAFNIGFPHFFLREQETHRLRHREWLVARIHRIQEKVVDLSKSLHAGGQGAETESLEENDNPFDLSDGLRWYMIDASEDKPGAPSTPGLGKSTVAANKVEATAEVSSQGRSTSGGGLGLGLGARPTGIDGVSRTLSKSLESRRSSTSSRKALPFAGFAGKTGSAALASETNSLRAVAADSPAGTSPTLPLAQPPRISTPSNAGDATKAPITTATTDDQSGLSSMPPPPRPAAAAATDTQTPEPPATKQASTSSSPTKTTSASASPRKAQLQREQSSASKKSVVWDPLWNLDYSYESGRRGKAPE